MNDERDIVAAIDRNTKSIDRLYEVLLRAVTQLIWISFYLLLLCFLVACIGLNLAKAAPLLPPLPEPAPLQYWHTTYIPTDGGVYPMEVFAPALPPIILCYEATEFASIGDPPAPPAPPVHVPEPSTWVAVVVVAAYIAVREWTHRDAKMRLNISALQSQLSATEARVSRYYYVLLQIEEIGGDSFPVAIARKALEE